MNLEKLNLVELDAREIQETDGGILGWIVGAIVGHVVSELIFNPQEHVDAWQEGYNSNQKSKS